MKRRVACAVPVAGAGRKLEDYLTLRFTYHTREEWLARIASEEIRLNGVPAAPDTVLAVGDKLTYEPRDLVEPPVRNDFRIVYADDDLCVIDKPGNLPVHPAGPYFEHTLWALLRGRFPELHFINRLDRETSGLLLAALRPESAARLSRRLAAMFKRYQAIVHGALTEPLDAEGVLCRDETSAVRKKRRFVPHGTDGEYVRTELFPVRRAGDFTLVEAVLHTGRLHQVRATLFSLGYPVVGDKLYGLNENFYLRLRGDRLTAQDRAELILERQALHCAELAFCHPADGRVMRFVSHMPEDMAALLD